ncbi:hypothetical protein V6N12_029938 [Hibiscus sabdariffa]|uniref:Uncharacterized protein n=1 Tax=Hibiscus sabdariffa TaxID=183260 RepID=A0ABR2CXK9_9ROSI
MADMTSSMASLALDDGEEELLQVDDVPSLQIISFANCLLGHVEAFCPIRLTVASANIVFHWDLSLRAPDRRPLPVNRWLRDENDGCSLGIKDDGVNCGFSFANLPDSLTAGNTRRWHFRFEATWLIKESCESEVKRLWDCAAGSIPDRLVELGVGLDAWFARVKHDRRLSVNDLRKRLVDLADLQRHRNHVSGLDSASGQYVQDPHDMA